MPKQKIDLVICRTCIRDNPEEGLFEDFSEAVRTYKEKLKEGIFKKTATLKYQNCFAQCENFFCVQVNQGGEGYLLKKISSPDKIDQLISWLKDFNPAQALQVPDSLSDHLVKKVKVAEKFCKA